jgi:hypothetical protein
MDLRALKSLPLSSLPVVSAISGLMATSLAATQLTAPSRRQEMIGQIAENLAPSSFIIGDVSTWQRLMLPNFLTLDFKTSPVKMLLKQWTNVENTKFLELVENPLPISIAFEKLASFNGAPSLFSKESFVSNFFPSQSSDAVASSSTSSIANSFFNTALPLSSLKDLSPGPRATQHTLRSTPNRQPYENSKQDKKPTGGLANLFQRFLKRAIRR